MFMLRTCVIRATIKTGKQTTCHWKKTTTQKNNNRQMKIEKKKKKKERTVLEVLLESKVAVRHN